LQAHEVAPRSQVEGDSLMWIRILAPAIALLRRVGHAAGFACAGAVFLCAIVLAWLAALDAEGFVLPAAALVAGLGGLYLLAALHLHVVSGLDRFVVMTERMAAGELISSSGAGVMRSLERADASRVWGSILSMSHRLAEIVTQVRDSSQVTALSAKDIAQGNHHLAERTQEQAAALEETASGMEQLAASAQQNAEDCTRARQTAGAARNIATAAAAKMQRVVSTMEQIDESSRRVAEILLTVEGLAFQTNILALNAAVEAAHAGDQGRGFSVVATEVRSLAQRCAGAAREIKILVAESATHIGEGRKMVEEAQATVTDSVAHVAQVSDLIAGIASASAAQQAGIQAINEAIMQIDSANQQNAGMVEEASAAADSLKQEAERLLEVVGRFKLDRSEDRGKAVLFVKEGAEHVRRVGIAQACADFNDRSGRFVDGEYYILAVSLDGVRLAYAPDTGSVGKNILGLQDADGKYLTRDLIETARRHGSGWVDFKFLNPKTRQVEPKSVYVERVGDVLLGCGIYRPVHTDQLAAGRHLPLQPASLLNRSRAAPSAEASRVRPGFLAAH
jgi:methyl-accepting chemotaxis protein